MMKSLRQYAYQRRWWLEPTRLPPISRKHLIWERISGEYILTEKRKGLWRYSRRPLAGHSRLFANAIIPYAASASRYRYAASRCNEVLRHCGAPGRQKRNTRFHIFSLTMLARLIRSIDETAIWGEHALLRRCAKLWGRAHDSSKFMALTHAKHDAALAYFGHRQMRPGYEFILPPSTKSFQ